MSQISLIIPIYNTQKFIKRALDSAINQSLENIEIICVDDCSQDKSMDIVKEFAKKDSRIKILSNPKNLGSFASRNKGVLAARSEFIMFLDSDDFLDLKACEVALNLMLKNKLDLLCFEAFVHRVKTKKFYKFKDEFFNKDEFLSFLLKQKHFCWSVWAKLFKKELVLKALTLLDVNERLSYGEDNLFCYVNFMFCERIASSKECLYHYEFNENGRYESKDKEILNQNSKDKDKSLFLLKSLSGYFKQEKFDEQIFKIFEKQSLDLKARIQKLP